MCWFLQTMSHVYPHYWRKDASERQRLRVASRTWRDQQWHEVPVGDSDVPRLFRDTEGAVPFLKDVLSMGLTGDPDHVVVFTNTDICVIPTCCHVLKLELSKKEAVYARRMDITWDFVSPLAIQDVMGGQHYVGTDLFAFRERWWKTISPMFPDMLLGRPFWDSILCHYIEKSGGGEVFPLIYHRTHIPVWTGFQDNNKSESTKHNVRLAKEWCARNGVDGSVWGVR